jgi:hypothetical protein
LLILLAPTSVSYLSSSLRPEWWLLSLSLACPSRFLLAGKSLSSRRYRRVGSSALSSVGPLSFSCLSFSLSFGWKLSLQSLSCLFSSLHGNSSCLHLFSLLSALSQNLFPDGGIVGGLVGVVIARLVADPVGGFVNALVGWLIDV